MSKVVVAGGGAAGMMAAAIAARNGHEVTLLEQNEKLGKKLFITGKGRCNVTNACEVEDLFQNVVSNPKFLYSAFYGFDNHACMDFFEELGVKLKVERGNRVFPASDHSSDIISALQYELRRVGVSILLESKLCGLMTEMVYAEDDRGERENKYSEKSAGKNIGQNADKATEKKEKKSTDKITGVFYKKKNGKKEQLSSDYVILATGGISYPLTGATGEGIRLAEETGHKVTKLYPALVPLYIEEKWCRDLMGLSLRNVEMTIVNGKKEIYKEFGEMLFTHYGVSGPLVLSASSYITKKCAGAGMKLYIDLKPALTKEQLDKRLIREFEENHSKQFKNILGSLFPAKLIPVMVMLSGIEADKKAGDITKQERKAFGELIKKLPMTIERTSDFNEAIITQGGVSVKDVNPSTMESKRVKGLYLAGEMLDLDALTGGFNLQIAWSTGYLAGLLQ